MEPIRVEVPRGRSARRIVLTICFISALVCGAASAPAYADVSSEQPGKSTDLDPSSEWITAFDGILPGSNSIELPAFKCPSDHKYFLNKKFAQGRLTLNGIRVTEPGGIGVTIEDDTEDYWDAMPSVEGWKNSLFDTATNWGTSDQRLIVEVACTRDFLKGIPGVHGQKDPRIPDHF